MIRSLKKGPFVTQNLLKKIEYLIEKREKKATTTSSRSSTVVPIIVGHVIAIHNGREYTPVLITDQIVGHKLGEFSFTRTFQRHIKSDKKSKRLNFLSFMRQKIHPIGFRIGITRKYYSQWYAENRDYNFFIREDYHLRNYIFKTYK